MSAHPVRFSSLTPVCTYYFGIERVKETKLIVIVALFADL